MEEAPSELGPRFLSRGRCPAVLGSQHLREDCGAGAHIMEKRNDFSGSTMRLVLEGREKTENGINCHSLLQYNDTAGICRQGQKTAHYATLFLIFV